MILNAHRAKLERLASLPNSGIAAARSDSESAADSDADPDTPTKPKPKRAKKASKHASKQSAPPMFDDDSE